MPHVKKLFAVILLKEALLSLTFLLCLAISSIAGGIKGTIKDDQGEPLAYATIFVKQSGTGTTTNVNGEYELTLAAGTYDIVYQYVGFQTIERKVDVGTTFIVIDITLNAQATVLQTVTVKGGTEDPAYTIMRKAIAKANYHRNQLDEYSARVYIKGAGQLIDYPWLAKRQLEKQGIEKGRVFVQESVSDIKYSRPNKFTEKVISIRSDGQDNNTSPNQYIFGSFYEPVIAQTVTPLSPKAFSYYQFEYLGTFKDRNYDISKIKVTPRSKGDNVVEGLIYLVEDWWSIHSMDIKTTKLGIDFSIKAVYAPIEDKAWLPVSHQFKVDGKVFGFEFEYKYLATVSDYKIKVNPEVYVDPDEMEVVDEKIQKDEAAEIQKQFADKPKDDDKTKQLQDRLAAGKEITRKELKTLIREYEKQEQKQQNDPEILFDNNFSVDSLAYKKDSTYWASIRPVPLTKEEIKGYRKSDSLAVVERKKQEGDTLKASKHKGFQVWDIVTGDNYKISKRSNFEIVMPFGGFNTVEGWNIYYKVRFGSILPDQSKTKLNIDPTFRYSFSRKVASGNLHFSLQNDKSLLELEGGKYIQQLNHERPIHHIVNTLTTLFLEQNLMKLYEREYVQLFYRRKLTPRYSVQTRWSFAQRSMLENQSDFKIVDRSGLEYTSNTPYNAERPYLGMDENGELVGNTDFETHQAFIGSVGLVARPWLKYRVRNGERSEIQNSSPTFLLQYKKGIPSSLGSDVDFDQLELGFRHEFDLGVRAHIDIAMRAGMFFNTTELYFMDYMHFLGNRTPLSTADPVGNFRLLDYYRHSTADKYFSGNLHYKFRKFLLTSIPEVRLMGIRENFFLNYLATPTSHNYTELGYSIDGILRIFRLEAAIAFQDGLYVEHGFRIGVTTNFGFTFSE